MTVYRCYPIFAQTGDGLVVAVASDQGVLEESGRVRLLTGEVVEGECWYTSPCLAWEALGERLDRTAAMLSQQADGCRTRATEEILGP